MKTKVFYFFCESCGGDTAAYELSVRCPYCHADRRHFRLIAEVNSDQSEQILSTLEEYRSNWAAKHSRPIAVFGGKKRKKFWAK